MLDLPQTGPELTLFELIPKAEFVGTISFNSWNPDRDMQEFLKAFTEQHQTTYLANILKTYTKQELFKEICSFKSLNNNWDGYGAIPLEIESAANAMFLISSLDGNIYGSIDKIFPNPHGTISIIWSNTNDETVSLEIGNKSMSYYAEISHQETEFFDNIKINDSEISKLAAFISKIS